MKFEAHKFQNHKNMYYKAVCVRCGLMRLSNRITESTVATNKLYAKIESAKKQGQRIYITIVR